MSKEEQEKVNAFIDNYLKNRKQIALIIFLIDARHAPTENEKIMYKYITDNGLPCLVIANKVDKIAPTKIEDSVLELQKMLNPLKDLTFLPFSSEKKIFSQEVLNFIEKYI